MAQLEVNEKYALSIYHFNLQYKAGDKQSYFRLHTVSMKPFLRFFDRHEQWKVSCEIQGHYLKFMQRHFPEDLKLFQKLNQRDQLELVSVHYSDQIYLAYPERDLQESLNINQEIFNELGLKRSSVWFGQENFFGPGIAERMMKRNGYKTALLNSHYIWHHDPTALRKAPLWKFKGIEDEDLNYLVSSGQGYQDSKIAISQNFCYWGDAELAFGSTPYASFLAKPMEQYLKNALKYKKLEKQGFKIASVEDYINRIKELRIKPEEGPYLTDGTWNIRYYQGVYLWMGYYRLPWEQDAEVRSLTYRSRSDLLVIEKLIKWAEEKGHPNVPQLKKWFKLAWKHLLLAEVSDSTGQQPMLIEIYYSQAECSACNELIDQILLEVKSKFQLPNFYITTSELERCSFCDERCSHEDLEKEVPFDKIANFFKYPVNLVRPNKNSTHFKIHRVNDEFGLEDRHYILDLDFKSRSITPFFKRVLAFFRDSEKKPHFATLYDEHIGNYAGIEFPLWDKKVIYSPACLEDTVQQYPIEKFAFKRTWLPLPNGLIGLGNNTYIIKHNSYGDTHIACTLNFEHTPATAGFLLLNPPMGRRFKWRFSLFQGDESEALEIANEINVFPTRKI